MNGHFDIKNLPLDDPRVGRVPISLPLVTVIVTNYNYVRYIGDCLASIARQTYIRFKCIIVDDHSNDESVRVIEEFIKSDLAVGRFTLVRHEHNIGQMGAFITGLSYADGTFVVYVDADDLLLEDFIEMHVRAHTENEPVAFTSSDQYQIDEQGGIIAGTHSDHKAKGAFRYVTSRPIFSPYWVWATTSSIMFRRSVLELIMPDESGFFHICADNYVCHFANLIGGSLLIPSVHGCYRRHGSNYFSSNALVGGCHPTGDMESHPKHHEVRLKIFDVLSCNAEIFTRILSKGRYLLLISSTVGPYELLKFASRIPPKTPLAYLILRSLLLRLGCKVRIFKAIVKGSAKWFEFGERAKILRIPGD